MWMTWANTGEAINNILMFATLLVIVAFPFWTFFLLRRNQQRLGDRDFKAKYFAIYENLRWKNANNWILLEPCISSFRMLLTCCALMYLQNWRTFQIMIALFFHIFVIVYNGQMQPFNDKLYYFFQ